MRVAANNQSAFSLSMQVRCMAPGASQPLGVTARRPKRRVLWWAVATLTGSCSSQPTPLPWPSTLSWIPFYWVQADLGPSRRSHAGIVTMTRMGRRDSTLVQLDLAASGTMPFGYPSSDSAGATSRAGSLHGLLRQVEALRLRRSPSDSGGIELANVEIGTLGLPLYERRLLVLDFEGQRMASPERSPDLYRALGAKAVESSLQFDGHRLLAPIKDGRGTVTNALIDTGLSPFPIWTTEERWRAWTGRTPTDQAVRRERLPSSVGDLVFAVATLRVPLEIGQYRIQSVDVAFLEQGPTSARLENWPTPTAAVLGVSVFVNDEILVIDVERRALTIRR